MAKRDTSESNSQSEERTSSESEAEETVRNVSSSTMMSEYEKQRLERIAENKARLKAMGLPQMVSSLKTSTPIKKNMKKKKGKEKVEDDDDDEYIPQNEEEQEHDESDSSSEQHEHDSDFENASGSRKRKVCL